MTRKNNWNRVICPPALSKDTGDKAELCVISTARVLALGPSPRLQQGEDPSQSGVIGLVSSGFRGQYFLRVSSLVYRELQGAAGGLTESCLCEAAMRGSVFPVCFRASLSAGGSQHCLPWSPVHRQHSLPALSQELRPSGGSPLGGGAGGRPGLGVGSGCASREGSLLPPQERLCLIWGRLGAC